MNAQTIKCPKCQRSLAADAPGGICPECLLEAAVSDAGSYRETLPRKGVFNAPSPSALSEAIESLEVQELLGHGGMGAVYRARQINLDRPVALKVLAPRLSDDPGFEERFVREAKTLARLNHANIVTVYDFGRAGEYCYLVMELIEGVNLRDAIVSGGITTEQALNIVPRICEALQYAHDKGVVHRDIKPENILVGLNNEVKIADFGLAKLLDDSDVNFTLTATRQVLGTRNYMAPEQIEKPTTVDHRADIYSLGVVFYELLTGELPLGRFSLPSEKTNVSGQMDDVVLRTLEKEPGRRYQQASEVKTAVEAIDLVVESPLEPINGRPSKERPATPEKPPVIEKASKQVPPPNESTGRRVSLPFRNDQIHGGLSQLHGIAHLNAQTLEIEFRVHKLGVAKSSPRTVKVPYSRLVHTILNRGMFSTSLEIHASSLDVFDDIPGSVQGCLKMTLDKNHDQLLEEFRTGLDSRISVSSPDGRSRHSASHASSLAHVPFVISEVHGGFSEAVGIAKVTNDHLIVEYEIKDAFGVVKSAPRIELIPVDDVIAMNYHRGVFGDSISVQTNGIDTVSTIPNSSQGKFKVHTKKRDRGLAAEWMRQAYRVTGLPMQENLVEQKPRSSEEISEELKQHLHIPVIWLTVCIVVNAILASLTGWLVYALQLDENSSVGFMANQIAASLTGGTNEWMILGGVGPLVCTILSIILLIMITSRRKYSRVKVGLILLVIPWHIGSLIAFPVALWLLIILRKNRPAYIADSERRLADVTGQVM